MTVIMFKKIGIVILIITITDDLKRKKAPIDLYFDNLGGLAMPPPQIYQELLEREFLILQEFNIFSSCSEHLV